jgi:ABC-type transport system involved in multi-copper enzyme maturation permease subunit
VIDALRFEWTRIRTLRSTYWLIGLAVLLSGAVALIIAVATRTDPNRLGAVTVGNILTGGGSFAIPFIPIFVAIIGVFATGHEYRHGTIQPTLMAIPQRSTLLIAKIVMVVLAAIFAVVLSVVVNYLIGLTFWSQAPNLGADPLNQALPGYLAYAILYTVLGLALGLLFRGVPTALVLLLVFPLVVEGLITGLSNVPALDWLVPVVKFLPFTAGGLMMALETPDVGADSLDYDFFGRWASGGIFAVFVTAILALAWLLFQKKDA